MLDKTGSAPVHSALFFKWGSYGGKVCYFYCAESLNDLSRNFLTKQGITELKPVQLYNYG